ncbi:G-protein coupled receptor-associated sorting protein 2-like [Ruditapes philippinarum]|uniref:G-protein coupled receptor-associated sorting protein 2-like n=1 Tax=Ruditapes philippinarum TaxID=129788 RepID=UPI00295B4455|nr:G-protein coupled receptor-associated sorting protein 2-like [Ruditapes philippinarum]
MAPSQSQVVTLAAGSALVVGVIFTIFLVKRKNRNEENSARPKIKKVQEKVYNGEETIPIETSGLQGEGDSFLLDSNSGPPLPDKEGLTISTSWAILNDDESHISSPHLSPVDSETSLSIINGTDNESALDNNWDDSASNTVLEAGDQSTILVENVPLSGRLSSVERETVAMETIDIQYEELLKEHKESESQTFSSDEIKEALMASQNPSQGLTVRNAEVLAGLLTFEDIHLKHTAVQGIANCATFSKNQDVLRDQGCLPRISKLLELQRMAMWLRHSGASTSVSVTINAVTNLATNEKNNKEMESCVPTLVDISLDKDTGEAVCLSSLQALTNLSLTSDHHGHYTRLVQRLYEFLKTENKVIQIQALKILVNLSCNPEVVPHLLAAKAPEGLLAFLQPSQTDDAIILRFVTLLANILKVVKDKNITSSSLPPDDKAASPETMYCALLGISTVGNVKNKVFLLCKHSNEDVKLQAVRVYNYLK